MKPAVQLRIAFAAFLIIFSASSAFAKRKKNPVLDRIREAYRDVLDGNEKDVKNNKRLLEKYKGRLKEHKRSPNADEAKHSRNIQAYTSLVDLYTRLVAANEAIIGMFDGTSKPTEVELAMEEIAKLEAGITRITRKDSKREWLTFGEVESLRNKGWVFKTPNSRRLPYLRKYWREPKESEKRRTKSRRRTTSGTGETGN